MRERFGALGIGPGTQVVAYDADSGMYAARLWWMLRFMGHDAVAVLDGGLARWIREGHADSRRPRGRAAGGVRRRATRGVAARHASAVLAHLADPESLLVDARAEPRFRGESEPLDKRAGHIPGACNFFFQQNLTDDKTFRSPDELRSGLAVAPQRPAGGAGGDVLRLRGDGLPQPAGAGARGPDRRPHLSRVVERVVIGSGPPDRNRTNRLRPPTPSNRG